MIAVLVVTTIHEATMSDKPLVSIIIPVYNSAKTLRDSLDSCLAQHYTPIEIIVVDDGSHDASVEIVRGYESQVRLLEQANAGPAIARNRGIASAEGDYIKFLDADDLLHPEHLTHVMATFAAQPDVAVVYTRYQHVLADGHTPKPNMQDPDLLSGDIFCDLLRSNSNAVLTSALTVKRQCLLAVGAFPDDPDFRHSEDWDLFLRLAARYRYGTVPQILVNYRWHDNNISQDTLAVARGRLRVWQQARHYAPDKHCFDAAEYDQIIAARYHVLAMVAWEQGQRELARHALQQAIQTSPQSRVIRQFYRLLTYVMPFAGIERINRALSKVT